MRTLLACLVLSGCVATRGDLEQLEKRIAAGEAEIGVALDRFEAGLSSAHETAGTVRVALAENRAEVARVADTVQKRGALWSQYALEIIGAAVAASVPGSVVATNAIRNRARRRRGEPVKVSEVSA